jgi:peroxiredoxin
VLCALVVPRLGFAAGPSAHCADDDAADATDSAQATPAQASRSPLVGTDAPDFTLNDAAGHTVHLRDLRGKVVVIDFWQSECPSSRAEMPYLQQLHDQYSEKDLAVLGLNIGEDAHQITEFATDSVYTFPLLVGADAEITGKYSVTVYPMTFVIDRTGKIIFAGSPTDSPGPILRSVKSAIAKKN